MDQKHRQVLYQRYIRATQVLYQLPIKTSGENRQMKQLGIFVAVTIEYIDDINYLCHVRYVYGMFPCNKSRGPRVRSARGRVIYCGNIPNSRDITNTYCACIVYIHVVWTDTVHIIRPCSVSLSHI